MFFDPTFAGAEVSGGTTNEGNPNAFTGKKFPPKFTIGGIPFGIKFCALPESVFFFRYPNQKKCKIIFVVIGLL